MTGRHGADGTSSISSAIRSLPGLSLILSLAGLAVAGYLTFVHYQEEALVCTTGGCETVQQSQYATIGPIPIAILGVGFFAALVALAAIRTFDLNILSSEIATIMAWGLTLTGVLYYAYLVYIEFFVLEAVCQWCMSTTVITVAIFVIESILLWRWYTSEISEAIE